MVGESGSLKRRRTDDLFLAVPIDSRSEVQWIHTTNRSAMTCMKQVVVGKLPYKHCTNMLDVPPQTLNIQQSSCIIKNQNKWSSRYDYYNFNYFNSIQCSWLIHLLFTSGTEHSSDGPIEMMPTKALDLLWQGRVVLSVEFGLTPAEFSASIVQLTFEPG